MGDSPTLSTDLKRHFDIPTVLPYVFYGYDPSQPKGLTMKMIADMFEGDFIGNPESGLIQFNGGGKVEVRDIFNFGDESSDVLDAEQRDYKQPFVMYCPESSPHMLGIASPATTTSLGGRRYIDLRGRHVQTSTGDSVAHLALQFTDEESQRCIKVEITPYASEHHTSEVLLPHLPAKERDQTFVDLLEYHYNFTEVYQGDFAAEHQTTYEQVAVDGEGFRVHRFLSKGGQVVDVLTQTEYEDGGLVLRVDPGQPFTEDQFERVAQLNLAEFGMYSGTQELRRSRDPNAPITFAVPKKSAQYAVEFLEVLVSKEDQDAE